jgi:hypothetical protein
VALADPIVTNRPESDVLTLVDSITQARRRINIELDTPIGL